MTRTTRTMRIFSSAENFLRVALRISLTMFLAIMGSFYLIPGIGSRAESAVVCGVRGAHFADRHL